VNALGYLPGHWALGRCLAVLPLAVPVLDRSPAALLLAGLQYPRGTQMSRAPAHVKCYGATATLANGRARVRRVGRRAATDGGQQARDDFAALRPCHPERRRRDGQRSERESDLVRDRRRESHEIP
jgi:hypothetical protein